MSFQSLRNVITTKLQTISKIAVIYDYPEAKITKFPAAVLVPSDNDSDYETVTHNERGYAYLIALYYSLQSQSNTNKEAFDAMHDLIDDVMNAFDDDPYFITTPISLPSDYTMIGVTPVPGAWGIDNELQALVATITIKCRLSYNAL